MFTTQRLQEHARKAFPCNRYLRPRQTRISSALMMNDLDGSVRYGDSNKVSASESVTRCENVHNVIIVVTHTASYFNRIPVFVTIVYIKDGQVLKMRLHVLRGQ